MPNHLAHTQLLIYKHTYVLPLIRLLAVLLGPSVQ